MAARLRKYSTEWQQREAVDRWRASGLSQAGFCRREGISEWALSEWKRRELRRVRQASSEESRRSEYGPLPKERRKLESYWRKVVAGQETSGLTATQFCNLNGFNLVTFKRWRRKFASAGSSTRNENPFVAVKLASLPPNEPVDSAIEIVLPGGIMVRVTERTPLTLLSGVLRAMEDKC